MEWPYQLFYKISIYSLIVRYIPCKYYKYLKYYVLYIHINMKLKYLIFLKQNNLLCNGMTEHTNFDRTKECRKKRMLN